MANARPGGPRRPELDYYEYSACASGARLCRRLGGRRAPRPAAARGGRAAARRRDWPQIPRAPAAEMPAERADKAPDAPAPCRTRASRSARGEARSRFGGVKALMQGVTHRVPEDEPLDLEPDPALEFEPAFEPESAPAQQPEPRLPEQIESGEAQPSPAAPSDRGQAPGASIQSQFELDDEDDAQYDDDAPQIDNPIGDALSKVRGAFRMAREKLAERARSGAPDESAKTTEAAPDESAEIPETALDDDYDAPASSRRMRKALKEQEEALLFWILSRLTRSRSTNWSQSRAPPYTLNFHRTRSLRSRRCRSRSRTMTTMTTMTTTICPARAAPRCLAFSGECAAGGAIGGRAGSADLSATRPDGEGLRMEDRQQATLTQRLSEKEGAPSSPPGAQAALAAGKPLAALALLGSLRRFRSLSRRYPPRPPKARRPRRSPGRNLPMPPTRWMNPRSSSACLRARLAKNLPPVDPLEN